MPNSCCVFALSFTCIRGSSLGSFERMRNNRPAGSVPPSFSSYFTANRGVANAEVESPSRSMEIRIGRMETPLGNDALRWSPRCSVSRGLARAARRPPLSGGELTLVLALLLRLELAVSLPGAFQHFRRSHGITSAAEQAEQGAGKHGANDDHRDDKSGHGSTLAPWLLTRSQRTPTARSSSTSSVPLTAQSLLSYGSRTRRESSTYVPGARESHETSDMYFCRRPGGVLAPRGDSGARNSCT